MNPGRFHASTGPLAPGITCHSTNFATLYVVMMSY